MTASAEIRRWWIRAKIASGDLPSDLPAPRALGQPRTRVGRTVGTTCMGCEEAISREELACDYSYPSGLVLRLHAVCWAIWNEERQQHALSMAPRVLG